MKAFASSGKSEPRRPWRGWPVFGLLPMLLGPVGGCAHVWDDLSARNPKTGSAIDLNYKFNLVFGRFDPLDVLAHDTDGDMRARAIRALKEPKEGQEDYQLVFNVLSTAAVAERDVICRVAAVEKLGEMKDPRCTQFLIDAYQAPINANEKSATVRIAALQSLGERRDPAAIEVLAAALNKRGSADERMAAATALGRFEGHHAAAPLVRVLREERDVAVKHRAYVSLQAMTGRTNIPPQPDAWEEVFRAAATTGEPIYQDPGMMVKLASWWKNE
jgi:hypothetical protein